MDSNMEKGIEPEEELTGTEPENQKTQTEETAEQEHVAELLEKETKLSEREKRLDCREYLIEKGCPAELLEIIDTSDVEGFKEKVDKLNDLLSTRKPRHIAPLADLEGVGGPDIQGAFEKTKHVPKKLFGLR